MIKYNELLYLQKVVERVQTAVEVLVGDLLEMRKPHPCGCKVWEVLRVGMDFRMRCTGCSRELMLPRARVLKSVKKIIRDNQTIVL